MQENQSFIFGGLDSDSDLRTVSNQRYIDGNDIEHFVDENNTIGAVRPMRGTELAYNIGNYGNQFIGFRIPFINEDTDYNFKLFNSSGVQVFSAAYTTNSAATLASNLTSSINTALGGSVTFTNVTNAATNGGFYLEITNNQNYTFTCETRPAGVGEYISRPVYVLQEAYQVASKPKKALATCLIGDWQIVLSRGFDFNTNQPTDYNEIGCARKDVFGNWTYTKIISSLKLNLPTDQVIDIRAELLGNNRLGIYWTDNTNKPKVLYANTDFDNPNYTIQAFVYSVFTGVISNPNGIYYLNSIDRQTDLQIFNNEAVIKLKEQLSTGGNLLSGGKRYYVRFGINGTENVTPPNEIGMYTIVYKADNKNNKNAVKIKGDRTPTTTTKQNILTVSNCKADVFNFLELICVEYQGDAQSATLVGRFDITADTVQIKHTGLEINSQTFDIGNLPNVTPVILKGKTNEIKKNRYNIANIELAVDDISLEAIAKTITIESARKTIPRVGELKLDNAQTNIFAVSGYETVVDTNTFKNGVFFVTDPISAPVISYNQNGVYSNGIYTADANSDGQQIVKINIVMQAVGQNSATANFINTSIENLNVFGADVPPPFIMNYTVYKLNSNDTFNSILAQKEEKINNINDNLELNVDMQAGEKIRIDWFVQGKEYTFRVASGGFTSTLASFQNQDFGEQLEVQEYQKAENVANNVGYMLYEPYYFYIRYHYKNGYISSPYYIGSHTIGADNEFSDSSPLTTADGMPYVYYPKFSNIDLSSIKQDITGFSIWRGDNPNKKVLATGALLLCNKFAAEGAYVGYYSIAPALTNTYGQDIGLTNNRRLYAGFLSPDNINADGILVEYQSGDELIVKGQPTIFNNANNIQLSDGRTTGSVVEYTGFTSTIQATPTGCQETPVDDAVYIPFREQAGRYIKSTYTSMMNPPTPQKITLGGDKFRQTIDTQLVGIAVPQFLNGGDITDTQDTGFYLAYYRRGSVPEFDTLNANIIDCGMFYKVQEDTSNIVNDIEVFGGDTYTQRNYVKLAYQTLKEGADPTTGGLFSGFISFYSQNRVNTQMRHSVDGGCVLFPADANSIVDYLNDTNEEFYQIDNGYNKQTNPTLFKRSYNSKIIQNNKYPARIYYSQQRTLSGSYDGYRDIKPLDFRDLDGKNGQIVALYDINDVMMTLQPFAITVLPYQSDVALSTANGSIYVGNGGVYAQRESIISTYGTNLQTCTFRGFNRNGNATLYWFSENVKKVFKYGREGVSPITDNARFRNFFLTQTKLIKDEFDMVMGFDTKRDNLWITSRAWKDGINEWQFGADYLTGNVVQVSNSAFWGYPLFFRALENTNEFPIGSSKWEQIELTNGDFYSLFTVLFNEKLNVFTTKCTALPERYFQYNNTLLSPNISVNNYSFPRVISKVFEYNEGTDKFFEDTDYSERNFYIEFVSNKVQNTTKRWLSIGLNVGEDLQDFPTVTFSTKTQQSASTLFEQKNGNIWAAVEPDNSGEPLIGEYLKSKIATSNDITLLDATSKFYYRPRLPR